LVKNIHKLFDHGDSAYLHLSEKRWAGDRRSRSPKELHDFLNSFVIAVDYVDIQNFYAIESEGTIEPFKFEEEPVGCSESPTVADNVIFGARKQHQRLTGVCSDHE
jgi:hypothetical protein